MRWRREGMFCILGWLLTATLALAATTELLGLRTTVDRQGTTFLLQLPPSAEYTPSRIGSHLFVLDLAGVFTDRPSESQLMRSPLVSSYRLLNYEAADGKSHLRMEILLKQESEIRYDEVPGGLEIRFQEDFADVSVSAEVPISAGVPAEASHPPSHPGTVIREVSVIRPEGDSLAVEIISDGALEYRTLKLDNPARLVLDIPNTINRMQQRSLPVNRPPLKAVRTAQFSRNPLVSRVVFDLDRHTSFRVQSQSNSLLVLFGDHVEENGNASNGTATGEPAELAAVAYDAYDAPEQLNPEPWGTAGSPIESPIESKEALEFPETESLASDNAEEASSLPPLAQSVSEETIQIASNSSEVPVPPLPEIMAEPLEAEKMAADEIAAVETVSDTATPDLVTKLPEVIDVPETGQFATASEEEEIASDKADTAGQVLPETIPAFNEVAAEPEPEVLLAQQTNSYAMAALAPLAAMQQAGQAAAPSGYDGEPISMNLKDVDLKDFFRFMHEISGFNVVLDPAVSGVVTIVLDEVPWDQAMDIVMKNNSLDSRVEGNVVRIATLATLQREEEQQRDLARAIEEAEPKVTVTRTLSYARANDMIATLKRFLSPRGDVIADLRTNTLIITDIQAVVNQMDPLIQTLDRKTQQVEIEARVVAASRSFARDIGVQLAASGFSGNVTLGGTGLVGTSPINRGTVPPLFIGSPPEPPAPGEPPTFANVAQPLATNLGAVGATSGLTFLLTGPGLNPNFAIDAIITAAEAKGIGKLLSRPKLITQNNVEATVKQGVRIPIQTTVNNTVSVQFVDVVLRLTVLPQITAEGTVFLDIDIENTTIDPGIARIQGIPALDTQSATTQVLVSNGGTVFFGGVIQNINNLTEVQVPLLGSIPPPHREPVQAEIHRLNHQRVVVLYHSQDCTVVGHCTANPLQRLPMRGVFVLFTGCTGSARQQTAPA